MNKKERREKKRNMDVRIDSLYNIDALNQIYQKNQNININQEQLNEYLKLREQFPTMHKQEIGEIKQKYSELVGRLNRIFKAQKQSIINPKSYDKKIKGPRQQVMMNDDIIL